MPKLSLLSLIGLIGMVVAQDYCTTEFGNIFIPPCQDEEVRSLLYVVDGSNSLSPSNFYNDMMDYCLALYCAFNPEYDNQVGMIIFNQNIEPLIELDTYTRDEWFDKIAVIRDEQTACCSCCTPTADAFAVTKAHFASNALPGNLQIALVITDGVPSNNNVGSPGNPEWLYSDPVNGFNPATYNYRIVPEQAELLRATSRLMLLAVPSADGARPDVKYFNAGYPNGQKQCIMRGTNQFCDNYRIPPFPITSRPIDENSFSAVNFDLQRLLNLTVKAVCKVPTPSPTLLPTSKSPTRLPSASPTKKPTSQSPSRAPSSAPTRKPTSKSPTKLPTPLPTSAPSYIYVDQVDLHILIDGSDSMWWRDKYCRSVVPEDQLVRPEFSQCWDLWMNFIESLITQVASITAGIDKDRQLGWADDFRGDLSLPRKGMRVSMVGFSCDNGQKTPRTFPFTYNEGVMISNRTHMNRILDGMRETFKPSGGTCPGMAIEEVVRYIEANPQEMYPLQAVVLLTDGVFYDMPFPQRATAGLEAYKAIRYSVGIAVNEIVNSKERVTQRQQLTMFAGTTETNTGNSRFFDLNSEGWTVLSDVAFSIAHDLPSYFVEGRNPIPRYSWCGWRRPFACLGNGEPSRVGKCKWRGAQAKRSWSCYKP